VLLNPAFENEVANGVTVGRGSAEGFRTSVNAQLGEASVTNPGDSEVPEAFELIRHNAAQPNVATRSNIGPVFLTAQGTALDPSRATFVTALSKITGQLHTHFAARQKALGDPHTYGIDLEYKLMQEPAGLKLYIKQSRLLALEGASSAEPMRQTATAKENGLGGAHVRRAPKQLSQLGAADFCLIKPNHALGLRDAVDAGNGFLRANVTIASGDCPDFDGEVFLFKAHFAIASK
jgi:hypothetical protein